MRSSGPIPYLARRGTAIKNRKKKGFTLLELVVALVVLAILAALSIPTYESVINSAKTGVADATAIAASQDAIAIGATGTGTGTGISTEANFNTVLNQEDNGVSLISYNDVSGDTTVYLSVTESGGSQTVCVTYPDQVNAAPTLCDPTTTTTVESGGSGGTSFTGSHVAGEPDCSVNVTGPTGATWSVSCTGVTGTEVVGSVPVPGGVFFFYVASADVVYRSSPPYSYAPLESSFTVDQSTIPATDDTTPGAVGQIFGAIEGAGYAHPAPDNSIGQYLANTLGAPGDSCLSAGTDCGIPSYTTSGF
jgi:prepilin-type N-terminal cleavage/methylation domain-containing protein